MAVALKRNIGDFLSGYSGLEAPEERKEQKLEGSLICEGFEELIGKYEKILAITRFDDNFSKVIAEIGIVLTPEQINSFLQATIRCERHKNYQWTTGFFITRLMQNSHNAGNNKFTLNTKALSKDIHHIGWPLKGRGDNLLEVIIDGDVGNDCGLGAKNIEQFYIGGNAGPGCGSGAENIGQFYIGRNAGNECGALAENIGQLYIGESAGDDCGACAEDIGQLYICGNVGKRCGEWAENIRELYIGGNAGDECGKQAENSTFKTPNKETLQLLKENVSKGHGNKIYFIHPNSQEEEIKW
ncbi:MAG: hypothetical protein ABIB71_06395 [Candidatus Woesearchaeota archaeon]